jgi:hypothetical protein
MYTDPIMNEELLVGAVEFEQNETDLRKENEREQQTLVDETDWVSFEDGMI